MFVLKNSFSKSKRSGFALPSVFIASIVMLAVLTAAITVVVASRTALSDQYYQQLAREAAESGAAKAIACLKQNDMNPTWSGTKPLTTNTDCFGNQEVSCEENATSTRCAVLRSDSIKTTFVVDAPVNFGSEQKSTITGTTSLIRKSNGEVWKSYNHRLEQSILPQIDINGSRASKRWWFFGAGAGIDFGKEGNDAKVVTSPCGADCWGSEGFTTATDSSGNLLFWTNGITIWNKNGAVMKNSEGLKANNSATQATVFFPMNKSKTKYAVISNTAESGTVATPEKDNTGTGKLYYSVIDMTKQGGLGEVLIDQKNKPLWSSAAANYFYSSEALAAAPKSDGSGFWILTYRPSNANMLIFDYSIDDGFKASPTEQPSGINTFSTHPNQIIYGTINFSKDYSKLVMTHGGRCLSAVPCSVENGNIGGLIRVMKFSPTSGLTTNWLDWNNGKGHPTEDYKIGAVLSYNSTKLNGSYRVYSADFSPNEEYIYTATLYPGRLQRYKIKDASSSAMVKSSEEFIAPSNHSSSLNFYQGGGQVLRGPDGKMYVANHTDTNTVARSPVEAPAISVIDYPDAPTSSSMSLAQRQLAVGWRYNGLKLPAGTTSRYGLPQMVTSFEAKIIMY